MPDAALPDMADDPPPDARAAHPGARFDCPRCGSTVRERFYGPCTDCREALRAALGGDAREVAAVGYEPKMNVTPNAVALKDD